MNGSMGIKGWMEWIYEESTIIEVIDELQCYGLCPVCGQAIDFGEDDDYFYHSNEPHVRRLRH